MAKTDLSIQELLAIIFRNELSKEELYLKVGNASEVSTEDFTFTFTPNDETAAVTDVQLKSITSSSGGSLILVPQDNSFVVVAFSSPVDAFCMFVEVADQIIINSEEIEQNSPLAVLNLDDLTIESTILKINSDQTIFNDGNNGALIIVADLTNKLNDLVGEVNDLKDIFNNHTHSGVFPGAAVTSVPSATGTNATNFDSQDYTNDDITH